MTHLVTDSFVTYVFLVQVLKIGVLNKVLFYYMCNCHWKRKKHYFKDKTEVITTLIYKPYN